MSVLQRLVRGVLGVYVLHPSTAALLHRKAEVQEELDTRLQPIAEAVQTHQQAQQVLVEDAYLLNPGLAVAHFLIQRDHKRPSGATLTVPVEVLDQREKYTASDFLDRHLVVHDDLYG